MEFYMGIDTTPIFVESEAWEGVKRVAETLAGDFERVSGSRPECIIGNWSKVSGRRQAILCATAGKSQLLEQLEAAGRIDLDAVRGRREVFMIRLIEEPFGDISQALVICGSDKRGTIYGMFTLSEYIGVTPFCYWGDAAWVKRDQITIYSDIEQVSKEPGVKYRGFFINDEWPCFGTWAVEHFGGFNAAAYKEVFEFLLRMKGNYLWPAMWSASFPLDGPGSANEELADIYGVIIGYSHHEPCLRASEEWDKVKGSNSPYGEDWNFYTNEAGLMRYWKDALVRSGKYENIITIGMRGERDTSMLGEDAGVSENVALLKDIIKKQRRLIAENVNVSLDETPQLLALYKEVEQYFYGSEAEWDETEGLKDYSELEHVICMLCEDNFGYMRTLPTEDMRRRSGGFGMYYHLDYHGSPVSYEWVDSTPLSLIWEQMCTAYEYGVREAWIVNAGDVKFHEVPLSYFMALAYDYETWGYSNPDSCRQYTKRWAERNFAQAAPQTLRDIEAVFTDYIQINHMRRPESLHAGIYHPCNYGETDRMLAWAKKVESMSGRILSELKEADRDAYYSMVHFPAAASMNLLKMHLYAGKCGHYAGQGRPLADSYGELVRECIAKDRQLCADFARFLDGKWNGMQLARHIGFTKWNEDGCHYPVICSVEPVDYPRMSVSRSDAKMTACKNYGKPEVIVVDDFLYPDFDDVTLEITNDGIGTIHYKIEAQEGGIPDWLAISKLEGDVGSVEKVTLACIRERLTGAGHVRLLVTDGDACAAVEVSAQAQAAVGLPGMTFLPSVWGIVIGAQHYADKHDTKKGAFHILEGYGKYGVGAKVFPATASFAEEQKERPSLTYRFLIREAGEYQVELLTAPTNPVRTGQPLRIMLDNHCGGQQMLELVPAGYRAGDGNDKLWAQGVLDQIRVSGMSFFFSEGVQQLTVKAVDAGVVLERIRIYPKDAELVPSYLGPRESAWVKE